MLAHLIDDKHLLVNMRYSVLKEAELLARAFSDQVKLNLSSRRETQEEMSSPK